jgi:uncharacterized membrane protein YhdT
MNQYQKKPRQAFRLILAILLGLLVFAYTGGIVAGLIDEHRRIDMVTLVAIALAAVFITLLLRPEVFARLKILEMLGIKLEMLEVRERQARQESELEVIRLILPVLLPNKEREHILNLAEGRTAKYKGNHELRTELRRLRSIELVEMRKGKEVNQLKDGWEFDLADYLKLTRLGRFAVEKIKEIDHTEVADLPSSDSNIRADRSEEE